MYRNDLISEARLTRSVIIPFLEQADWAAVFTAESGYFSAARLQHLFALPFPSHVQDVIVRENDDREASYEQGSQLREWSSQDFY
jgi:hypothetical protein